MQILVFEKTLKFVDSIMAPTNKQLDNFSTHKKLCFTPEDFNLLHEDVFLCRDGIVPHCCHEWAWPDPYHQLRDYNKASWIKSKILFPKICLYFSYIEMNICIYAYYFLDGMMPSWSGIQRTMTTLRRPDYPGTRSGHQTLSSTTVLVMVNKGEKCEPLSR